MPRKFCELPFADLFSSLIKAKGGLEVQWPLRPHSDFINNGLLLDLQNCISKSTCQTKRKKRPGQGKNKRTAFFLLLGLLLLVANVLEGPKTKRISNSRSDLDSAV